MLINKNLYSSKLLRTNHFNDSGVLQKCYFTNIYQTFEGTLNSIKGN